MNFAERAFRYLFRKKGKAIILFWVLLITETMILSTVTILRASEVARIELLGKSKAKLLIEREKAEELFTDDEYKKLEKLENVKAVNRVAEVQLYPMDFKIIHLYRYQYFPVPAVLTLRSAFLSLNMKLKSLQ